jgi:hypothetical protein
MAFIISSEVWNPIFGAAVLIAKSSNRMDGIVARMGEIRSSYRILVRKPQEKRSRERRRGRSEDNIITHLINGMEFLDQPSDCHAFQKGLRFMSQLYGVHYIDHY